MVKATSAAWAMHARRLLSVVNCQIRTRRTNGSGAAAWARDARRVWTRPALSFLTVTRCRSRRRIPIFTCRIQGPWGTWWEDSKTAAGLQRAALIRQRRRAAANYTLHPKAAEIATNA
ncbi:hypothetical protein PMIN07_005206 [Paraphaeosphaeria minitans]|uniref:Uncharacterized protein n=1 Tax=Paraphaeosphaeria minitans TaxID=565426 RepID=A0A9P6GNX5_9PLEO|nr:hypothetical protein PMIN01_03718 [Paraphaeosphaeria minitans]